MYWITKTGKKIKISQMKTNHILSCIKIIDKQNYTDKKWLLAYKALKSEYNKRMQKEFEQARHNFATMFEIPEELLYGEK